MSSSDSPGGSDSRPSGRLFEQMSLGEIDLAALGPAFRKMPPPEAEAFIADIARAYEEQRALLDIARALGSQLGLLPLLEQILARTSQLLQADRASVFLLDRQRRELWSKVAQGMETAEIPPRTARARGSCPLARGRARS